MGNMDDVMHRKDEQERAESLSEQWDAAARAAENYFRAVEEAAETIEAWAIDAAAIQDVFAAARVEYLSIEPEANYFVVTVPAQVNIQQRCERLDKAAGDEWTVYYSVRVWEGRHVYVVRRRGT